MNLTQKAKYNEIAAGIFTLYIVVGVIMKITGTGTLDDNLAIACGDGAVRILELQRAGKGPMKAADFLRGTPLKPPARLS